MCPKKGEELSRLRREHDVLTERSVGAMSIAEGDPGWDRIKLDCPMLLAVASLRERFDKLERAVRRVVTRRADDLCWRDVYTELSVLVGVPFNPELIESPDAMLANCRRFVESLRTGGPYVPVFTERNPADLTGLPSVPSDQ